MRRPTVRAALLILASTLTLSACTTEDSQSADATTRQSDATSTTTEDATTTTSEDATTTAEDATTTSEDATVEDVPEEDGVVVTPPDGGQAAHCSGFSETLRAQTAGGNTLRVTPAANGRVELDGNTMTLRQAVNQAADGDTVLLADGTYTFPESDGSNYTGLYLTTPNVTVRSESGDASAVILDSNYADHGGSTAPITISAPGIVLADFTVQRSIFHLVHFSGGDGDDAIVHNVRMIDGGQQFMKSSSGGDAIDNVLVSCSTFLMTPDGRDNVWGYGSQDGGTRCYTGGIDTHNATNWIVRDSHFEGIYCNPDGVQRPAHGKKGGERNNQTYTGGLSEHAIHMWDSVQGTGHLIERNHIVNCARGIGIGLRAEVYGATIRNNMLFSEHAGSGEHDVAIILERAHDSSVTHNTILHTHPQAYSSSIEYRWDSTANLTLANNLTSHRLRSRDNAPATLEGNIADITAAAFRDPPAGDLHLADCALASVAGQAAALSEPVTDDIDLEPRTAGDIDVGADQCNP